MGGGSFFGLRKTTSEIFLRLKQKPVAVPAVAACQCLQSQIAEAEETKSLYGLNLMTNKKAP